MKPITYWVQNAAINAIVDLYGAHLEKLTPATRRDLIAELLNGDDYGDGDRDVIEMARPLIENLARREKDRLIEAIAATLTHQGNPWLETAREMVAIAQAQKTGSPKH